MPHGDDRYDDERHARTGRPLRERDPERRGDDLEEPRRLIEPPLRSDTDDAEERVHEPVLGMEEPVEDDRRRDEGRHIREVVGGPVDASAADLLEQEVGDDEGERDLERDREDDVGERRRQRAPEVRTAERVVVEPVRVVAEAAERSLDDVPLEEGHVEGGDGREDLEDPDDDDRRQHEEVRLHRFEGEPPPLADLQPRRDDLCPHWLR